MGAASSFPTTSASPGRQVQVTSINLEVTSSPTGLMLRTPQSTRSPRKTSSNLRSNRSLRKTQQRYKGPSPGLTPNWLQGMGLAAGGASAPGQPGLCGFPRGSRKGLDGEDLSQPSPPQAGRQCSQAIQDPSHNLESYPALSTCCTETHRPSPTGSLGLVSKPGKRGGQGFSLLRGCGRKTSGSGTTGAEKRDNCTQLIPATPSFSHGHFYPLHDQNTMWSK